MGYVDFGFARTDWRYVTDRNRRLCRLLLSTVLGTSEREHSPRDPADIHILYRPGRLPVGDGRWLAFRPCGIPGMYLGRCVISVGLHIAPSSEIRQCFCSACRRLRTAPLVLDLRNVSLLRVSILGGHIFANEDSDWPFQMPMSEGFGSSCKFPEP